MPLSATNFVTKGPVMHQDMLNFFNLFTGVMTDQPVTFKNVLSVGGSQGTTTVPVKLYGAVGQTSHLLDLYTDSTNANPGWGIAASGQMGWGPGGAAPVDTTLSRVATQNGHASDTAGLLISPYLEVVGSISATSYLFSNSATLTGPTANPFNLVVNNTLAIVSVNERIKTTSMPSINVESSDGGAFIGGLNGTWLTANALYDGTNWQRINTANPAAHASFSPTTGFAALFAPAGANPIGGAWVEQWHLDASGNVLANAYTARAGVTANSGWFLCGADGTGLMIQDANSRIFSSSRTWYFDQYQGGWIFRNTANASISCLTVDGAGNMTMNGNGFTMSGQGQGTSTWIMSGNNLINRMPGTWYFQNPAGSATMMTLDQSGNLSVAGNIAGVNLTTTANAQIQGGIVYYNSANTAYVQWDGSYMRVIGGNGVVSGGNFYIAGNGGIFLGQWDGTYIHSSHSFCINGTYLLWSNNGSIALYWDGSNLHMTQGFVSNGNINAQNFGAGYAYNAPNAAAVYGQGYANAWVNASARRFKDNIAPLGGMLDIVRKLDAVEYDLSWTLPDGALSEEKSGTAHQIGFVADDWLDVVPEIVSVRDGEVMGMDYARMTAVLFSAFKEYASRTDARIDELETLLTGARAA